MKLTQEIKEAIDQSVLCWLATVSKNGVPNVSPKECFTHYGTESIIVANIASPNTVRNIGQNRNVCLSILDILVQKGFQIHGKARIFKKGGAQFEEMFGLLNKMTKGKFPFKTITKIDMEKAKPIIAPSYLLYPETTEEQQIENSKITYGF